MSSSGPLLSLYASVILTPCVYLNSQNTTFLMLHVKWLSLLRTAHSRRLVDKEIIAESHEHQELIYRC
jgi:hypothetical protein